MSVESAPKGIKVVLLGDAAAGKSSLLIRFATGEFNQNLESTIGAAFKSKIINYNDIPYRLDIWDTAGQERYRSILPMYYRNAAAAILVVDVTQKTSLKVASRWIMDIRQKTDAAECFIILAVNKVDLPDRAITIDEIAQFCEEKGIDYIETSALSGYNVVELFTKVCEHCSNDGSNPAVPIQSAVQLQEKPSLGKKKCC